MNQIISQHGWCLSSRLWKTLKDKFVCRKWIWQDNERGYFSEKSRSTNWIKNNCKNPIKMAICHSLGTHLIEPHILYEATHIVLINSFESFIPINNEKKSTIRALNRMENKFNTVDQDKMFIEFSKRSFYPNPVDKDFDIFFRKNHQRTNINLLKNDFKKLYIENKFSNIISKNSNILVLKSKQDLILRESSCDSGVVNLKKQQIQTPQVIELLDQGHIPNNSIIFDFINQWINKKYD